MVMEAILVMWPMRNGYDIHCDIVNPRWLELEVAKKILAELYDIQIRDVDARISRRLWIFVA